MPGPRGGLVLGGTPGPGGRVPGPGGGCLVLEGGCLVPGGAWGRPP